MFCIAKPLNKIGGIHKRAVGFDVTTTSPSDILLSVKIKLQWSCEPSAHRSSRPKVFSEKKCS